jgi:hypothetical protein
MALLAMLAVYAAAAGVNHPDDLPFVDAMLTQNAHDFMQNGTLPSGSSRHS